MLFTLYLKMKKFILINLSLLGFIYLSTLFLSDNTRYAMKMRHGLLSDHFLLKFLYKNQVYFEGALYETKLYPLFIVPMLASLALLFICFKKKLALFWKLSSILPLIISSLILYFMKF